MTLLENENQTAINSFFNSKRKKQPTSKRHRI